MTTCSAANVLALSMATVTVEAFSAASVAPSSASEMVVGEAVSDRTGRSPSSVMVTG